MQLALVISSQCNAACVHCTTNCGPTRTEALSKTDILRLMDEAAAIRDGESLIFDITGGEPFLSFDLLHEVVAYGAQLGGQISCVTNAFWARTESVAASKLSVLQDAGLIALAVSVSRFHQRFVPLHRVRRALRVAARLGLSTAIKGAVTNVDLEPGGLLDDWKKNLDAEKIDIFPVLPYLREGALLPASEYYREPGLPEQACPNEVVCIEPDGTAFSCCGPSSSSNFLALGSVHREPLSTINSRFQTASKQAILRNVGPIEFARGAIAAGLGHLLRSHYAGPCDLCAHIGSQPDLRRVADNLSSTMDSSLLRAHATPRTAPLFGKAYQGANAISLNTNMEDQNNV